MKYMYIGKREGYDMYKEEGYTLQNRIYYLLTRGITRNEMGIRNYCTSLVL